MGKTFKVQHEIEKALKINNKIKIKSKVKINKEENIKNFCLAWHEPSQSKNK